VNHHTFQHFSRQVEELTLELYSSLTESNSNPITQHVIFKHSLATVLGGGTRVLAVKRFGSPPRGLESLSLLRHSLAKKNVLTHLHIKKPTKLLNTLSRKITGVFASSEIPVEWVGMVFENFYGAVPEFDASGKPQLGGSTQRRDGGVFFTPPELVSHLVEATLRPRLLACRSTEEVLGLRILDPAMGAGFFLLECLRVLSNRLIELQDEPHGAGKTLRRLVVENCLYGVDIDPLTVDIARALLWIEAGDEALNVEALAGNLKSGDSLLGMPGAKLLGEQTASDRGFDVILSNPPWGKIKPEYKEFYAHLDEEVSFHQGQSLKRHIDTRTNSQDPSLKDLWDQYSTRIKAYSRSLQELGIYSAQKVEVKGRSTGGDSDLYKYFLERAFMLLKPDGRMGMVVPAAFHRSEGATGLRRLYLGNGQFEQFLEFENRKRLFPIHGMFRFLMMVYERGRKRGIKNALFGLSSVKDVQGGAPHGHIKGIYLSDKVLKKISGDYLTVPEMRSKAEKRLLEKLHELHPALGDNSAGGWDVSFVRELDMTNDSEAFVNKTELLQMGCKRNVDGTWVTPRGMKYLPLYEGRMVHQFDNAAKAYEHGQARTAKWVPLPFSGKTIKPHYYVATSYLENKSLELPVRAGFCDVTGHANERTVLAALIPKSFPCGNKVPTCAFNDADDRLHLLWIALANSFVIDWLVRRRISTTLNFFHWYHIPFPRVRPTSPAGAELISLSAQVSSLQSLRDDLSMPVSKDVLDAGSRLGAERATLRAKIDAAVAELFDLSLAEYCLILKDFQILDRYQPPLTVNGTAESKSTITRDKAVSAYLQRRAMPPAANVNDLFGATGSEVTDLDERVNLAEQEGAIAYVPSELAAIL
jgi:hypothetical protein